MVGPTTPNPEGAISRRRAQRTGAASLTLTLPKWWVDSMHVSPGDTIRVRNLGAGRLELQLEGEGGLPERPDRVMNIEVGTFGPEFLTRLLVGGYVTGQDRIVLTRQGGFSAAQRRQIGRAAHRVLGMSVVQDLEKRVEVQVFVDPTRHTLPQLRQQMVRLLRAEIALVRRSLAGGDASRREEMRLLEEEVDRFYLLMVRQLLLASDDFRIAQGIGVPSHHYEIGDRLVAKMLEMIGDRLYDTGRELLAAPSDTRRIPHARREDLENLLDRFDRLLVRTMDAFTHLSPSEVNATLDELLTEPDHHPASPSLLLNGGGAPRAAALLHRVTSGLLDAWEMLVAINEVAFNRCVEPETLARDGAHPAGTEPAGPID